jgi:hypothetical protein
LHEATAASLSGHVDLGEYSFVSQWATRSTLSSESLAQGQQHHPIMASCNSFSKHTAVLLLEMWRNVINRRRLIRLDRQTLNSLGELLDRRDMQSSEN